MRERIAAALERIAAALEKCIDSGITGPALVAALAERKTTRKGPVKGPPPVRTPYRNPEAGQLVKTYCDAYRSRYGTYPIVDGKVAGLATNLLRAVPLARAQDLVQAFLQLNERWFVTKAHAFDVLISNLNVVAVSLAHGTQSPDDKRYWERVFRGENHATISIQGPSPDARGGLGGEKLLSTRGEPALAGFPDDQRR